MNPGLYRYIYFNKPKILKMIFSIKIIMLRLLSTAKPTAYSFASFGELKAMAVAAAAVACTHRSGGTYNSTPHSVVQAQWQCTGAAPTSLCSALCSTTETARHWQRAAAALSSH